MTDLIEVVLDLPAGLKRAFADREVYLSDTETTAEDLQWSSGRIGDFGADNRRHRTHAAPYLRYSQPPRRRDGLTRRYAAFAYGITEIIKDIVTSDKSILLLGRPGVGKTTLLREAARVRGDQSAPSSSTPATRSSATATFPPCHRRAAAHARWNRPCSTR